MKKKIIPIFVPHEGCPHDCIFCNQKKITGVSTSMDAEKTRVIIEQSLKTIPDDCEVEIAFFGGSFTAIDREKQVELLSVANEYKKKGIITDIRMSTRPDCIDEEILEIVKSNGATIIELGVQSMDEIVLEKSIRGHKSDEVVKSARMIKNAGIKLGLQMMIGLPGDSEKKSIETARAFVNMKPDFVRIYPTLVIKETGLEIELESGAYRPFSMEETIDIVKKIKVIFDINHIYVIRMGLQATDDIQPGKDVLAGPYHPAFRELVQSRMIRDYLDSILPEKFGEVVIYSANRNISSIVGDKRSNRKYINEKYNAKFMTVVDDSLQNGFIVEVDSTELKEISFYDMSFELAEIYGLKN